MVLILMTIQDCFIDFNHENNVGPKENSIQTGVVLQPLNVQHLVYAGLIHPYYSEKLSKSSSAPLK